MSIQNMSPEERLSLGISGLGLEVDNLVIDKLMRYLQLLTKWNKTHNLTAITDLDKMVDLHIIDSLSVLKDIKGPNLLDVGSGAGLPGLVIALFRPDIDVASIDTRGKKIQFQTLAAASLGIENFTAIHSRVEGHHSEVAYQQIISRAFSSLSNFISLTKHLIAADGEWLAMKGQLPIGELEDLKINFSMSPERIEVLTMPALVGERHLLTFKP